MQIKNILLICFVIIASNTMAQQTDMSLIPYRQGDKWGYCNEERKIVIAPKYQEANWFSEGYAGVKMGGKYGYINKTGTLVIPARYTVAKAFRKGYVPDTKKSGGDTVLFAGASLLATGEEICINSKGIRMPQCPAISENSITENSAPLKSIEIKKTYSLPDNTSLFDKISDDYSIAGSNETYYVAEKNDRYGVFNSKFETIVPFDYHSIKVNRKSAVPFLQVNKGGMFGIMMLDGKMTIAPEYTNLVVIDGKAGKEYVIIQKEGKTYVKDISNRDIISSGYSDVVFDDAGFIITNDNNMRGYYFMDNSVIQPKYMDIKWLRGSKFLVVKNNSGKIGYVNYAGDEFFAD